MAKNVSDSNDQVNVAIGKKVCLFLARTADSPSALWNFIRREDIWVKY
jgi:hypothetical protein